MSLSIIKPKLIAIGSLILAMLTLGGFARYQRNKRNEAERRNEQLKQVTNDAIQRQQDINNAYQLDADDINSRLQQDYRD